MTYNPGQFNVVAKHLNQEPKWLILGGPSDGNEAQCAKSLWPDINILGLEPNERAIDWQRGHKWPKGCDLLQCAIADFEGHTSIRIPPNNLRCASLMLDRAGELEEVNVTTINALSGIYPFQDAILWLDIEGFEYEALVGASRLFDNKQVLLVNVEILQRRTEATRNIHRFLRSYNFRLRETWNVQEGFVQDRIYTRRLES